jgi:Virulence-associated protein E
MQDLCDGESRGTVPEGVKTDRGPPAPPEPSATTALVRIEPEFSGTSGHSAGEASGATLGDDGDQEFYPPDHSVSLVRAHFAARKIEVLFDGSFNIASAPRMATHHGDVAAYLAVKEIDETSIIDDLLLQCKALGIRLTKGDAKRALRQEVGNVRNARFAAIIASLVKPIRKVEKARAKREWARLATAFELDTHLIIAILKHFVWQVKQKALGRRVNDHLMPVVFSKVQGTGKTTFALKFLSPLEELATGPVSLSDFVDLRSGDIYRYLVALIDDMDSLPPRQVPVLKSLLTSTSIRRRELGTSQTTKYRQRATLLGTSNNDISEVVNDNTGHRRFAMLPFRNGAVAKGGDPTVWKIVGSIDYVLLWRSVKAFKPSPIKPYVNELLRHQEVHRPDVLKSWLVGLDFESEDVRRIQTRDGARAQALHELFCVQTGRAITMTQFGIEMRRHVSDPAVPFGPKIRTMNGVHYPLKKRAGI